MSNRILKLNKKLRLFLFIGMLFYLFLVESLPASHDYLLRNTDIVLIYNYIFDLKSFVYQMQMKLLELLTEHMKMVVSYYFYNSNYRVLDDLYQYPTMEVVEQQENQIDYFKNLTDKKKFFLSFPFYLTNVRFSFISVLAIFGLVECDEIVELKG